MSVSRDSDGDPAPTSASSTSDAPADPSHLSPTDLRAAVQLAMRATLGIADLTEAVHQSVRRTLGMRSGDGRNRTTGLTGWIYRTIRTLTRKTGRSTGRLLKFAEPLFPVPDASSPERDAFLSVLNGVLGDHLAEDENPLALPMHLLSSSVASASVASASAASPPLLLFIHGLCLNEQCWNADAPCRPMEGRLPERLAAATGGTPLFVRYNTGRGITDNGRDLAARLDRHLSAAPLADRPIILVGHSMGGRVADAALRAAHATRSAWLPFVRDVVYLGTPHRGAPLERIGHHVDTLLERVPYAHPFAAIGTIRSRGIMDLRHGPDTDALPTPSYAHVDAHPIRRHLVAGSLATNQSALLNATVGDGLVPIQSALGLRNSVTSRYIAHDTGHLALLHSPAVADHLSELFASLPMLNANKRR